MKGYCCLLAVLLFFLFSCSSDTDAIKPTVGDITESVYASGKVKVEDQYTVFATVSGILQQIKVKAGDTVKTSQPLFVLENVTAALNTENARLAMELSRENSRSGSDKLQEMELNVRLAREKYELDSSVYARQQQLWNQGIGSKYELEQRKLAVDNSRTNYASARSRLAQVKTQLENEVQRARVGYDISRKQQSDFIIRSTLSGRVYDVLKEQGELITPQTPLAIVGKAGNYLLELEVDENDIARVHLGQQVLITMDSYKGKVFTGVVDKIYPIMNERSRTFTIDAHFENPPKVLYPNLTVEANIVIQTKKNALTIPRNYLVDGKYVWIDDDEKKEVKVGLQDYHKVEIVQGLDSGQLIYKPK